MLSRETLRMILAMTWILDPTEIELILRRNAMLGQMSKCPFADENMRGLIDNPKESKGSPKDKNRTNP